MPMDILLGANKVLDMSFDKLPDKIAGLQLFLEIWREDKINHI